MQVTVQNNPELEKALQYFVKEFGADGVQALVHAYKTEATTKAIVKNKVNATKKKLAKKNKKFELNI